MSPSYRGRPARQAATIKTVLFPFLARLAQVVIYLRLAWLNEKSNNAGGSLSRNLMCAESVSGRLAELEEEHSGEDAAFGGFDKIIYRCWETTKGICFSEK